uniref:Ig-like domain-containing protein n=1 Tax=Latimeria chalumnae TaxID=7897 RepID=H3ACV1_LATCH
MFLLVICILASFWPGGVVSVKLEQPKLSETKLSGKSVQISCKADELANNYIHWYRHLVGEGPTRILYFDKSSTNPTAINDQGFPSDKFDILKREENQYILKIHSAKESDSGMYYCASWDTH